jgi:hypothetical protein
MLSNSPIVVRLEPPLPDKPLQAAYNIPLADWREYGFYPLPTHHDDPFYPFSGVDADEQLMRRRRAAEKLGRVLANYILKVLAEQDPVRGYPPGSFPA